MNNNKIKFAFFGTGNFAVKILDILIKNGYVPQIVVTTPDKPKGRKMVLTPSPIKERIMDYETGIRDKIKLLQPEKLSLSETEFPTVGNSVSDIFIVADYGKILPKEIINIPKYGTLNVHPSLLPKFRGPSPIQSFILSDEEETGVTIILMDEEMDHGPIISNSKIKNQNAKLLYYKELQEKLAELGGNLLVEIIPDWINEKIKTQEQDHSNATFTKKMTKEDGLINWEVSPEIIMRKIRALTPWPGAYFFIEKNDKKFRIIITDAEIKDNKIIIKSVKPEGRNEMLLKDFLRGNKERKEQIKKLSKNI